MTEQLSSAFVRALLTSLVSAGTTGIATWQTGADRAIILATTITAFLTPFVTRGGLEGFYDSNRHKNGQVRSGDVGYAIAGGKGTPANAAAGQAIPLTEGPYWVEVGTENFRVLAARARASDGGMEYLVAKPGGTPHWVAQDDVDQVLFP
ncbi:MAG: hypothetical protein H0V86_11715 [Chloroflexia bacterium]|nr:hypothetical protein [Chloroflexia bacterium]